MAAMCNVCGGTGEIWVNDGHGLIAVDCPVCADERAATRAARLAEMAWTDEDWDHDDPWGE